MMKNEYKGRIISVALKKVKLPNGNTINLDCVHHPGATAIVPILNNGDIVLIRQYRYNAGGYIYEIPAGTLGTNELPLACAKRELIEETGYSAKTWKKLLSIRTTPGFSDELIHIYLATDLHLRQTAHEADEVIKVQIFSLEKVKKMLSTGKIVDAKTIAGLSLALLHFKH